MHCLNDVSGTRYAIYSQYYFLAPYFISGQNSVFHDIPEVTEASPVPPCMPPHPVFLSSPCAQSLGVYEGAIFALGVSGKWEKAVSLLDDIEAIGLVPDEGVYAEVVVACGKVRRLDAAATLVLVKSGDVTVKTFYCSAMRGVRPCVFVYSERGRETERGNVALANGARNVQR